MSENSDFNDLKKKSRGGLKAVQAQVQPAIDAAKGTPYGNFIVKPGGVFYLTGKAGEDGEPEEKPLCSYLSPVGVATNNRHGDYSLIMELKDPDQRTKRIIIRMADTQVKGGEVARVLFVGAGGTFAPGVRSKVLFTDYLNSVMRASRNLPRVVFTPSSGWVSVDGVLCYILPGCSIIPRTERNPKK